MLEEKDKMRGRVSQGKGLTVRTCRGGTGKRKAEASPSGAGDQPKKNAARRPRRSQPPAAWLSRAPSWGAGKDPDAAALGSRDPPTAFESQRGAELPSLPCPDWLFSSGCFSPLDGPRVSRSVTRLLHCCCRETASTSGSARGVLPWSCAPAVRSSEPARGFPGCGARKGATRAAGGRPRARGVSLVIPHSAMSWMFKRCRGRAGGGAAGLAAWRRPAMNLTFPGVCSSSSWLAGQGRPACSVVFLAGADGL